MATVKLKETKKEVRKQEGGGIQAAESLEIFCQIYLVKYAAFVHYVKVSNVSFKVIFLHFRMELWRS